MFGCKDDIAGLCVPAACTACVSFDGGGVAKANERKWEYDLQVVLMFHYEIGRAPSLSKSMSD